MARQQIPEGPTRQVRRVVETTLPTRHGVFRMLGYQEPSGQESVALVVGDDDPGGDPQRVPLVRLHSECLTGDALGSRRCDCGEQLDAALGIVAAHGRGAVLYLRGHEGRGIGLLEKLKAYALQDQGLDTVDANTRLGHPADARDYGPAAAMLHDLGLDDIVLLSSNPAKQRAVEAHGITVQERRSLIVPDRAENATYLATKRLRMAHDHPQRDVVWEQLLGGIVPDMVTDPADQALVERYGPVVSAGRDLVLAQLAQSLDGFIASRSGHAEFVSGEQDREHLHRLRALVDAVVVGGATVCADDCRLTVRAGPGADPVRVVLDPRARVSPEAQVLAHGAAPTLWVLAPGTPAPARLESHVEVLRLPLRDGGFDPAEVLSLLSRRGLRRVLVEGGGRTVSAFLDAGVLDRLYVTTAPMLIGDGVPGIRFDGAELLSGALRPTVRRFLLGDDVCTELWLTADGQQPAAARAHPA
jgi:GTP cyclohydrolase II